VLLDDMATAPLLTVSLELAQGQVALAHGDLDTAQSAALTALETAQTHGFALAAVDAAELRAAVSALSGDAVLSRTLTEGARAVRNRLGYRFASTRTPARLAPS
jgi:hypothetical protein